jgi:large subunit ribosomal protein L30
MSQSSMKQLKVTLAKSRYGRLKAHRDCIAGLGLRKVRQTVTVEDTPAIRGMINKVSHLVTVEEA